VLALGLTGNVGFAADAHYYVNDPLATTVAISDAACEIAAIEADALGAPLIPEDTSAAPAENQRWRVRRSDRIPFVGKFI
jgi:hypothetical protein